MFIGNLPQNSGARRFQGLAAPNTNSNHEPKDAVDLGRHDDGPEDPGQFPRPGQGRSLWAAALLGGSMLAGAAAGTMAAPQVQVPPAQEQVVHILPATGVCANPVPLFAQTGAPYELDSACLSTTPTVRDWGRARISLKHDEGKQIKTLWNGSTVTHSYNNDRLMALDGKTVLYETNPRKNNVFTMFSRGDLDSYTKIEPAGVAGRYVSVLVSEGDSRSEAPEQHLMTIHQLSGRHMKLTDMMDSKDYHKILQQVAGVLEPANEQELDLLDETVNENFALFKDAGDLKVQVQVPDSKEPGKVHEFTFNVPDEVLHYAEKD